MCSLKHLENACGSSSLVQKLRDGGIDRLRLTRWCQMTAVAQQLEQCGLDKFCELSSWTRCNNVIVARDDDKNFRLDSSRRLVETTIRCPNVLRHHCLVLSNLIVCVKTAAFLIGRFLQFVEYLFAGHLGVVILGRG